MEVLQPAAACVAHAALRDQCGHQPGGRHVEREVERRAPLRHYSYGLDRTRIATAGDMGEFPRRPLLDGDVDARIEGTGGLLCIEVDTQPGTTRTSFVPELAMFAGTHLTSLCNGWWRTPRPVVEIAEAPN